MPTPTDIASPHEWLAALREAEHPEELHPVIAEFAEALHALGSCGVRVPTGQESEVGALLQLEEYGWMRREGEVLWLSIPGRLQ